MSLWSRVPLRRVVLVLVYLAFGLGGALTLAGLYVYARADDRLNSDLRLRTVNDVTQLNPIQVGRVETPRSVEEVAKLLRETTGPVSIGGARCSMGGQTAEPGSLHLDMRQLKRVIKFVPAERQITVQTGMRWRDLQDVIDQHDLSVKIMQTYANFSIGGTLSVNAHGRYMGRGPVVQSVRAIKLVLADGEVVEASPSERPELFYAAIGGYGGIGVIVEATLELASNEKVERRTQVMERAAYARFFEQSIRHDPNVIFHNADLHPPDFDTLRAVSWVRSDKPLTEPARLIPRGDSYFWTPRLINDQVSWPMGAWLRKHVLEPIFYASDPVTYRNHEASYDIAEIEPASRDETTFVLREYFIPQHKFDAFVPKLRDIFQKHEVRVVNVSVRHASADPGTLLAWARGETFAFVVYYEQGTSEADKRAVGVWSRELVDAVVSVGGTYYLPYQVHSPRAQFLRAYPRAEEFFALKRKVDPQLRFQNTLWHAYGDNPQRELDRALDQAHYKRKPEGQTLLTVPEWYLVFNPLEYADHLAAQRPSDAFPFLASLEEYWSQYKKVLRLAHGVYPENAEYLTMLRVIGVSTAAEYLIKAGYENTIGALARWTSSGEQSAEDRVIRDAFRAYSDLIYSEPWYAFEFLPWVRRIWCESALWGDDFIRRSERKLAFSLEFMVKAVYAELIGWASRAAYDTPEERVQLVVDVEDAAALQVDARVQTLRQLAPGRHLISVPRWGGFSQVVPMLAARGVRFVEIAGNDDITLSVLMPRTRSLPKALGQHLFDSRLVSDPARVRRVLFVRVKQLADTLRRLAEHGAVLEHLYDY